ncbi:Rne/Rng family ribonuclease [Paraoerskovia marina]|uniref:Rne/Rng family ribonuclease n=1 Tax=Paraoerskovia marina TaxID=545619 RepID=UPI002F909E42
MTREAGTPVAGKPVDLSAASAPTATPPATAPTVTTEVADTTPTAAPRRRRAATRTAGSPTASASTETSVNVDDASASTTADAASTEAPAAKAPAKKAPAKKSAAGKAPAKKAPAKRTAAKKTDEPAETPEADSDAPAAEPKKATARKAPAKKAPAKNAPAKKSADDASASTRSAEAESAPTTAPATPRLAGTALLFQAPEPTRRPRRVTKTAPTATPAAPEFAGPTATSTPSEAPEKSSAPTKATARRGNATTPTASGSTDAPETSAPSGSDTTEAASPQASEKPAKRGTRKRAASRPAGSPTAASGSEKAAGAPETKAEADAGAPVVEAEAAPSTATDEAPVELSRDEAAAVAEVETIEAELVAEGIEVPSEEFEPEVEDEELVERPRRRRRRGGRGRRRGPGGDADGSGDKESDDDTSQERTDEDADATSGGSSKSRGSGSRASDGATASDDGSTDAEANTDEDDESSNDDGSGEGSRRRRRRRRGGSGRSSDSGSRSARSTSSDEVTALKGSTRLEAKRQRRRDGRDAGRRRQIITEAEFLARRESVERSMIVREVDGRTQIAVIEDDILVEHYVSQQSQASMVGNVYVGRVQNVLPSMEAAFIDVGKGRNAVLYAGEVNWDAAGLDGQPRRIEQALKSGDSVRVQVTKDPIGHKGARLTSQVTLAGRYLVFVPGGGMTGISRKLPDTERARLKKILKEVVPEGSGVIVRTAAEGASEAELRADVERLQKQWERIEKKTKTASAPALLQGEPDMAIRVVRDIFNDDFSRLVVSGDSAWDEISNYVAELAPDLRDRVESWTSEQDVFSVYRVDEQLAKGMDRKVWLPSGGSLVIDRTEAMTVIDVNTGKFTGAGGTLEETVTRNNLEAAEEIVRQLRLRDIGGIIVVDFIDMVLESNRDLVLRRLVECLGRDRTRHQVAEVTSLGLVQMTRKRVGQGLVEAFSETCEHCHGRGFIVHDQPIEKSGGSDHDHGRKDHKDHGKQGRKGDDESRGRSRRRRSGSSDGAGAGDESTSDAPTETVPVLPEDSARAAVKATLATIAAAAAHAHEHENEAESASEPTRAQAPEPVSEPAAAGEDAPPAGAEGASSGEPVAAPAEDEPAATRPALDLPRASAPAEREPAADLSGDFGIVLPDRSSGTAPRKGAEARAASKPVAEADGSAGEVDGSPAGPSSDD